MKRGVMSAIALVLASAPHNCSSFGFRGDCAPGCKSSVDLGDGWCDDECNVEECEYDKGDCDVALRAIMSGTLCARDCRVAWIGDWTCDPACNVAACDFDGGDCMGNATWSCSSHVSGAEVPSGGGAAPAPPADVDTDRALMRCARMWLGDGSCDLECNSSSCRHDNGDCLPGAAAEFCGSAGCRRSMVNNSVCNYECFSEACGWDGADCHMQCALGCHKHFLGDKRCNPECNVAACNFDLGDCTTDLCSPGCTRTMVNDNQCDEACLTRECQWDGADCDCAAGCLVTWLGDGECDAQCNIAQCDFDAGDCSGSSSPTAPCGNGCLRSQQGDGICQPACNVPKCQWDFGDCHFSRRVWPALAEVGGGQVQQPAQQAAGSASGNSSRARETAGFVISRALTYLLVFGAIVLAVIYAHRSDTRAYRRAVGLPLENGGERRGAKASHYHHGTAGADTQQKVALRAHNSAGTASSSAEWDGGL